MADIQRTTEDDPNRCQHIIPKRGQCPNKAYRNGRCLAHGDNIKTEDRKAAQQYRLGKWQARMLDFKTHPTLKTLQDEIGILRILLEETVSRCTDATELTLASAQISDLIAKIEKTVISCHKLDKDLGNMISKTEALNMSDVIIEIVTKHVTDSKTLEAIAEELYDKTGNVK